MIEIPWGRFSEEELLVIISAFYEHLGFGVYNLHRIQRSEERGADLILSKEGKRVAAIGVKIKPRKKDAYQLIELSRRKEKDKIYVFIGEATPQFKEEMERYRQKIHFLNAKELTHTFFENTPYFASNLFLDTTIFSLLTARIRNLFLTIYHDAKKESPEPGGFDESSLKTLWRLKDNSAVLYKTNLFFMEMFDHLDKSKFTKEGAHALLRGYDCLLALMGDAAKEFERFLKEFLNENRNFIKRVVQETRIGSNWAYIFSFKILSPGSVEDVITTEKEREVEEKELVKKISASLSKKMPRAPPKITKDFLAIFSSIENTCMGFKKFWWGVEEVIDDFFDYALHNRHE